MPTPKPTPEQLEQFNTQFKRTKVVDLDVEGLDQTFVLRPPTVAEYKMHKDTARRGEAAKALERLVTVCIVFPDRKEVEEIAKDFPALFDSLSEPVAKLAGLGDAVEKKIA